MAGPATLGVPEKLITFPTTEVTATCVLFCVLFTKTETFAGDPKGIGNLFNLKVEEYTPGLSCVRVPRDMIDLLVYVISVFLSKDLQCLVSIY